MSGHLISGSTAPLMMSDKDFEAVFAHSHWTVSWHWSAGEPKQLQSSIGEYKRTHTQSVHEKYTKEFQRLISKAGWLNGRVLSLSWLLCNQP